MWLRGSHFQIRCQQLRNNVSSPPPTLGGVYTHTPSGLFVCVLSPQICRAANNQLRQSAPCPLPKSSCSKFTLEQQMYRGAARPQPMYTGAARLERSTRLQRSRRGEVDTQPALFAANHPVNATACNFRKCKISPPGINHN